MCPYAGTHDTPAHMSSPICALPPTAAITTTGPQFQTTTRILASPAHAPHAFQIRSGDCPTGAGEATTPPGLSTGRSKPRTLIPRRSLPLSLPYVLTVGGSLIGDTSRS